MTVNPVPTLVVAGVSVAVGPAADGSMPPLVAIGKLSIPWGRATLLEQPTPATCSLQLLDTSPGATFARRRDLKGQLVRVGWTTGTATGTTFRGRVTDVTARPRTRGRPGFVVTLSCSSKEVDAANYRATEGTAWPAETMGQRLTRIRALMPAGLFAGGITMPDRSSVGLTDVADPALDFADYPAAAVEVGGQDALALLRGLWRSLWPAPLVYDPAADALGFLPTRQHRYDNQVGGSVVGQLVASPSRGGRYVVKPYAGLSLAMDAVDVPIGGPLTQPLETALTRVEVTYTNPSTGQPAIAATGVFGSPSEAVAGRRTLAVESVLRDAALAAQLAGQWASLAAQVALPALVDPVTYRPTKLGGFDDAAVSVLLAGRERPAELFLGRSWLTRLGVVPLFGLTGGSITYADGAWELQLQLAPVSIESSSLGPIRAGSAAASSAIKVSDIDRSVAVEDLRHVHIGAGYTYSTQPFWTV